MSSNDEFCITCKANLTQGQKHSESCKFLQDAEAEKKKIKEQADEAILKAKEELDKKLQQEKENITKEAKQQLLDEIEKEKQKTKELQIKKQNNIKSSFIKKILQFDFQKQVTPEELEKMNLDDLMKYYEKIIKIHVADKKTNFKVSCPKCFIHLGNTITQQEAIQLQKSHKKSCPKNSNIGKWILLGLTFAILSGVALAFTKSNPQLFKKGDSKNE